MRKKIKIAFEAIFSRFNYYRLFDGAQKNCYLWNLVLRKRAPFSLLYGRFQSRIRRMSITDEKFFAENIIHINHMISRLLWSMNAVPILLIIFTYFGIFSVPFTFSLGALAYAILTSAIHIFLVKNKKFPKFTMYFGLFVVQIFIALLGTQVHIGIYVAYGIVPIMTCLYYDRILSRFFCIFSYIGMILSLFIKFKNGAEIFGNESFAVGYIPVAVGFTIEFAFVLLVVNVISERNNATLRRLMSLADDRGDFVEKLRESKAGLEQKKLELEETQSKLIKFVAEVLGSHDLLTGSHVIHTQKYVELISKHLRETGHFTEELTDENIEMYSNAAFLHDIGKIHIPEGILNKFGKFTVEEFEMMKSHPKEGKELLSFLPKIGDGRFNEIAIKMAYCHHEKWDGTGYPERKRGNEIPLCARIMAAADVLDALISKRYYKEPMSIEAAMRVFYDSRGTHFEPCIADAVIELQDKIAKIDGEFKQHEAEVYKEKLEWWQRYHRMKNST